MNPSKEEILTYLIDLLRKKFSRKKVTPADRIFHDLGIEGDDAWDLFEKISLFYGITDPAFDMSEYFPSEGDLVMWPFSYFIPLKMDRWKPMTVENLADIIFKHFQKK